MRIPIALAVLALALLVVPGAFADRSYVDPSGDSGAAPDITGVKVSHDAAGVVSLAVTTNQPVLAADASFWGYIDTDRNATTGFPYRGLGAEHFFIADGDGGVILHVNGNIISVDFDSSFSASYARRHVDRTTEPKRARHHREVRVPRRVRAGRRERGHDRRRLRAPDAPPFFEYSFVPLALTVAPAAGTPKHPVAGKRFVVSAKVTRSDAQPFGAGSVVCAAKAGNVALRPIGSVVSGVARCAMKVPKGTTGKTLRGSVTVSAEDSSPVKRPFTFRIS